MIICIVQDLRRIYCNNIFSSKEEMKMLEEQGRQGITGLLKKLLKFLGYHIKNIGKGIEQKIKNHISETGKKSVKSLVKQGRDLELSDEIKSKDHLKSICVACKKQGLSFALQKTDNGYRLLYQRKDSVLAATAIQKVLGKQLVPKRSVVDVMKSMQKIKQPHITRNAPIKHREVGVR
jgi:hypothetical protein